VRFLFAVIANRNQVVTANSDEMTAIDLFNEEIEATGQKLLAVGLQDPSSAVVFDNRSGEVARVKGPIVDADDFMAGLWVIEAPSEIAAHELAKEASRACNRRIEVRAIL
jgi:hypothetical protein